MKTSLFLTLSAAVLAAADLQTDSLKAHNQYRSEHAASALTWNSDAAAAAQAHADKCQYGHSNNNEFGENIAAGYESIGAAIKAWGDEREQYDFNNQGFSSECGHFTQIVWKATTTVGCGAALCDGILGSGKQWFHVCNYHTPGNVEGQYEQNVSPQGSGGAAEKPVEGDGDKSSGDKTGSTPDQPSKTPEFEYEEPSNGGGFEGGSGDFEDGAGDFEDSTGSDDFEYVDSDDSGEWEDAHDQFDSRNKWNPFKTNKYTKFKKWSKGKN